jgi:GT2 family glycosyltransferase/glycosyltransferase involved in cell wall biosynthesis
MTDINSYLKQLSQKTWLNQANQNQQLSSVDIVVPVFNGFNALEKCVQSLLKHTNPSNTITFLNDASTDDRVNHLLQQLVDNHSHIQVVNQHNNVGYLNNVNSFMVKSTRDVVLLNSDTQVTAGWLSEMLQVAADQRVGAVCPLSNNATLLTITAKNSEDFQQLKHYSNQWYPIPTAVGFCMLIKQHVISKLGGFDSYYNPGYGEECDYSLQIRNLGLQVACAPAAFVYHIGSQSFQTKAEKLKATHQKLLDLRWPKYTSEITRFLANNPTNFINQKLKKHSGTTRILHVLHGLDSKGGVELFTRQLLNRFNLQFQHTVLIPERNTQFKSNLNSLGFEVIELHDLCHKPDHIIFNLPADLYHQQYDLYFQNLLLAGGFELVHFHSLIGVGTSVWPLICYQHGIPYQMFIHDHFGLCQVFTLSTKRKGQESACGKKAMELNDKDCQQCLAQKTKKSKLTRDSFMSLRHEIWSAVIKHAERLYFPSEYLLTTYQASHPVVTEKSTVIKPCFYPEKTTACKVADVNDINVAFLGQFGELKGAQLFIDFYHAANRPEVTWHIFGGCDPRYDQQLAQTNIKTHGQYESSQLPELLKDIDLVVLTSVFPETYGITLTEAWVHGIPVLAPNLGAYSLRVTEGKNGYLYQHNDLTSLMSCFENWLAMLSAGKAIKAIQYQENAESTSVGDNVSLIQDGYRQATAKRLHKNNIKTQESFLNKPGLNASEAMQNWLESTTTLEADADWLEPLPNLSVLLMGNNSRSSKENPVNLLPASTQMIDAKALQLPDIQKLSDPYLVIDEGCLINENLGNWINDFKQSGALLGTADHALHNHNKQLYAPQFQQRFSWQNHLISRPYTACMLIKPQAIKDEQTLQLIKNRQLNDLIERIYQINPSYIHHFPYLSHSVDDTEWASQWKRKSEIHQPKLTNISSKVLLLIESNLDKPKMIGHIKKQSLMTNGVVDVTVFNALEKSQALDNTTTSDYEFIGLLNDNLAFKNSHFLEKAISILRQSSLDALSPIANNGMIQGVVAGKKWGAANHFMGIGRIRDTRFDQADSAFEYDLLDDDIMLFKAAAFKSIKSQWERYVGHYLPLHMSHWLHKTSHSLGLCWIKGLIKQGVPNQSIHPEMQDLQEQRQAIINEKLQFPIGPVYSASYSARSGSNLDLTMPAFKTPKRLPRIIGYAHDDWASGFYRVKGPLTALAANNQASIHFLPTADKQHTATPYELHRMQADTLLLHHFFSDQQLAALIQYKKQTNMRIVLGVDDLLTDIPSYNPFSKLTPSDTATRIKLACSLADCLVVSTEKLAETYSQFHKNTVIIPNRLSQTIWHNLGVTNPPQEKLRIGWAGAAQHQHDLKLLKPVIEATQGCCDWVIFGEPPKSISQAYYQHHQPVALADYAEKLNSLQLDLAVAPLVDNSFNQAKSNLKLLEFGTLGIPVIASDLAPYLNSPANLQANNPDAWINTIQLYHKNRNLLEQHGKALQEWVQDQYILEDHLQDWLDILLK